jgi:hypothetical protein
MEEKNLLPLVEGVNEEATAIAKNNKVYQDYARWLQENGCKYPSVIFQIA